MSTRPMAQGNDSRPWGGTPVPAHAIVVGLDESAESIAAVEWAAAEAVSCDRPLHLLHAVQPPLWPDSPHQADFDPDPAGCVVDARRALADSFPGLPVSWSQPYGSALPALTWASRFATLVVVGTRARGPVRQVVTGSTAVELIADGHCPIVVVHAPLQDTNRSGPVVLGLAGQGTDDDALRAAFRAADQHHRSLNVVHATDYGFVERVRIERLVTTVQRNHPDVAAKVHVKPGNPADLLISRSNQASLLVLGARGRHEAAGVVLGSVSQSVLRRAACPVLVVRAGTLRPFGSLPEAEDAGGERLAR